MAGAAGLLAARAFRARLLLLLLFRPNSALDNTAPVARSLASCASSVSIRPRDVFAALRSRAFSLDRDLIAVFWRRDLLRALHS